jgi:VWFA-related protein
VQTTIGSVELKGRQSGLYDASFAALEKLGQSQNQKRVLLIISGSSDNKSVRKFSELRRTVREKGYLVYTVGILDTLGPPADVQNDNQWESEMRELGVISGGLLRLAGDPNSVLFQFAKLSLEFQRQYMIGFVPTEDLKKEQYHKVQVMLSGTQPGLKGLKVRSREGYSIEKN